MNHTLSLAEQNHIRIKMKIITLSVIWLTKEDYFIIMAYCSIQTKRDFKLLPTAS